MKSAEEWIKDLELKPHPEGGFYKEMYRSDEKTQQEHLPERYSGDRNFATSIYFLLRSEDISAFHKIQSDELWYFHAGETVEIHILHKTGLITQKLGSKTEEGEHLQALIPRQHWFAAKVLVPNSFILVSCVVAPAFDFTDFELANRKTLIDEYPDFAELIVKFTKNEGSTI
ncbi:MAG: cupin domain-containing protein [Cytophagales bacterium]